MNRTCTFLVLGLLAFACSSEKSSAPTDPIVETVGVCQDTCLKACSTDGDCSGGEGELCCDYGADGKACVKAKSCPRFCAADSKCDSTAGEACLRTNLESASLVCASPKQAVELCANDATCGANQVCCTIYKEPVCLAPDRCPQACTSGTDCRSEQGEVCCTTLAKQDTTLGASGLCVDPKLVACPTACTQSSDCDTATGELCCEGTCSKRCVQKCTVSADCRGQICCRTPAVRSPFVRPALKPGYPVPKAVVVAPDAGGSGGAGGAGGSGGSAGTGGRAGAAGGDSGGVGGAAGRADGGTRLDSGAADSGAAGLCSAVVGVASICGLRGDGEDPDTLLKCTNNVLTSEKCAAGCQVVASASALDRCLADGEPRQCLACGIGFRVYPSQVCAGGSAGLAATLRTCACSFCSSECGTLCNAEIGAPLSVLNQCNLCIHDRCPAQEAACAADIK